MDCAIPVPRAMGCECGFGGEEEKVGKVYWVEGVCESPDMVESVEEIERRVRRERARREEEDMWRRKNRWY